MGAVEMVMLSPFDMCTRITGESVEMVDVQLV